MIYILENPLKVPLKTFECPGLSVLSSRIITIGDDS